MARIQELVVDAVARGQLKHDNYNEMPVDRIGALAHAPKAGRALRHLQANGFLSDFLVVREAIARYTFPKRKLLPIHRKIAEAVIAESEMGNCPKCAGRGMIVAEGEVRRTCSACNGTTRRRHSDAQRSKLIGCSIHEYHRKWEKFFAAAHDKLSNLGFITNRKCNRWLGRV